MWDELKMETYETISRLNGLQFVRELLDYEKKRFDTEYLKGSVYEEINLDFGPFPPLNAYPVYFQGDIKNPQGKTVFIGINPGFSPLRNKKEQKYLDKYGLFEGYCHIFSRYFKENGEGLRPYYANVAGFLKRYQNIKTIDWDWLQDNFLNLELIPYHSTSAQSIQINELDRYYRRYFIPLLKILDHIQPQEPVFINGFSSFADYFAKSPLNRRASFRNIDNFWLGRLNNKYDFIGLPFLTRVAGGKDKLVRNIKAHVK